MSILFVSEDNKLEPGFMTKKQLVRAYRYGTLNPEVKVTSNDYRWFDKYIKPIENKIMKKHANGRAKRGYSPREVKFIFDLLLPPTITR